MKFKKFIATVISVAMLISCVGIPAYAKDENPVALTDVAIAQQNEEADVPVSEAPIVVTYADGYEKGFESLASAMRFGYSGGTQEKITVYRDISESMDYLEGNIVSGNPNGVTIKNTIVDSWIYCDSTNFTIGEGVTYDATGYESGLFVYGDNCVINGTVITDCYYQRYSGTKLTINEPGNMTVKTETFILRYTDSDPNAGIYVVGDNNDETVGLNVAVVYFYQGMISAKDANIKVGTYWQTNETDGQGSANLVLDNTEMTVTVNDHNAKATGNSTVTLKNGSSIDVARGFETSENATVTIDETSSVTKNGASVFVASLNGVPYASLADAVASAENGDTVTLISDVTVNATTIVDKDITLDLNGKTITNNGGSGHHSFRIAADVTVKNGTIDNTAGGYCFIIGYNTPAAGNLTIESGKYYGNTSVASVTYGSLTTNGGYFEATPYNNAYDFTFNCVDRFYTAGEATITVNGGTFYKFNPSDNAAEGANTNFCADGYAALADLDGNYVVGTKPTATVNNLGATVVPADGYMALGGGSTANDMPLNFVMQFLADQDADDMETSPYAEWYGDFVITFTGLENDSFTADGCYLAGHYGDFGWIKVPVDGMVIEEGARYPVMLGVDMGQKYDYICSGVKDFRCAMYLTPEVLEKNPNIKVNLELCLVDNSKGSDVAKSAIINNENCYTVEDHTYVADDFVLNYVAEDANGRQYLTLADALAQGGNVKLIDNVELKAPITVDNTVTLDLNSYDVTYTSDVVGEAMFTNKGDFTIDDTSENENGKIVYTYTGEADTTYGKGNYTIYNYGKLTVNAGTVRNATAKMSHAYYTISCYTGAEVTVNGGEIICDTSRTIRLFTSSESDDITLTVNNGKITGTAPIYVQLASNKTDVAPEVNVNINGGELNSTDDVYNMVLYSYNYGNNPENVSINVTGGTINGDILVTGGTTKTSTEKINITGGTFNGNYGVHSYAEDTVASGNIVIKGGTFKTDYARKYSSDDGYIFTYGENGYGVVESPHGIFGYGFHLTGFKPADNKYRIGLCAGIDSLEYKEVGFRILHDDNFVISSKTTTVYEKIVAGNGSISAKEKGVVGLFAILANFPKSWDNVNGLTFQPYAIDLTGNTILGRKYIIKDVYPETTIEEVN